MSRVIVTDFFGVIVSETIPVFLSNHVSDKEKIMKIKDNYCKKADIGEYDYYKMLEMIASDFNMSKEDVYNECLQISKLNDDYVKFIKSQGLKIILLSNAPKGLVELIKERYNLDDLFDEEIISYRLKISKPNEQIYNEVYKYVSKEDEILFIDDNIANLSVPKRLKWNTILYKDFESFKEEYKRIYK